MKTRRSWADHSRLPAAVLGQPNCIICFPLKYLIRDAIDRLPEHVVVRAPLDVVAVDAEFLIALDPHERSITKFFVVRKPLERLKFAPARANCSMFLDSNTCRYPYLLR